jgi:hypothetical protein
MQFLPTTNDTAKAHAEFVAARVTKSDNGGSNSTSGSNGSSGKNSASAVEFSKNMLMSGVLVILGALMA